MDPKEMFRLPPQAEDAPKVEDTARPLFSPETEAAADAALSEAQGSDVIGPVAGHVFGAAAIGPPGLEPTGTELARQKALDLANATGKTVLLLMSIDYATNTVECEEFEPERRRPGRPPGRKTTKRGPGRPRKAKAAPAKRGRPKASSNVAKLRGQYMGALNGKTATQKKQAKAIWASQGPEAAIRYLRGL